MYHHTLLHELECLELTDFAQTIMICTNSLCIRLVMHAWMFSYNRVSQCQSQTSAQAR